MTRNDLAYVHEQGWIEWLNFRHQPTTHDILNHMHEHDRYAIQLIGGQFNVYDLKTLKRFMGDASIGMPVFVTEDYDAALTWAVMQVSISR